MNRRVIASLLIIVLLVAGAYAVLLYMGGENPVSLSSHPSASYNDVLINEVSPKTDTTSEFIELYTTGSYEDMEGWIVTTYDDDQITLPALTGSTDYLFLLLVGEDGTDDLDVSDGQVTIYLGSASQILDTPGDEVGLHDDEGLLVSFFRYGGGNGDAVLGDWSDDNDDLSIPTDEDNSMSLLGNADGYENSWIDTLSTPGEPNVEVFQTTGTHGGEEILIANGIRDATFTGDFIFRDPSRGENVTVSAGPGVNATILDLVKEHINFSLNYFREHNFTDPATNAAGQIVIRVVQSFGSESTGISNSNGEIVIRVGTAATKEELKVVGEHELLHLFQFKQRTDVNGSSYYPFFDPDYWWDEGMAEFWGVSSMLKNYPNMTMALWNQMARQIGSLNWFDHYRDTNKTSAFDGWTDTWDEYMASFLFVKFLNETFGTETLLEVFNSTRFYNPGDARNVDPKDALVDALNMTWSEIYGQFLAWLFLDAHNANGVPLYTAHVHLNYTSSAIGDTVGVLAGGGAVIEEIEISNSTSFRIRVNCTGSPSKWAIVVLIFYEDGTNESISVFPDSSTGEGEIVIDPESPKRISKIWVVKSVTDGSTDGRVTMNVIPNIEMTYNNATIGDTVVVNPNDSVYEVIEINSTQAFSVFLNWTQGNYSHWKITVIRFWEDGSNDTFVTEIVNGTWPGYVIDPDAGPVSITKLVFIKENLNETPVEITMVVTPTPEISDTANNPIDSALPYHVDPVPWDENGGLLTGYLYVEDGVNYELISELAIEGEFLGYVLNSNLEIVQDFTISSTDPILKLSDSEYDAGLYYIVIYSGPEDGLVWNEVFVYS